MKMKFIQVSFLIFAFVFLFFTNQRVFAKTDVHGDITSDTVWTPEGSPYIILYLDIATNTTLTISPGTVVLFDDNSSVQVEGKLVADALGGSKIYFSSVNDNTLNGEDPNSELIVPPMIGDYYGINVYENGYVEMNNVDMKYFNTAFFTNSGTIDIKNSSFEKGRSIIQGLGSKITLSNVSINDFDGLDSSIVVYDNSSLTADDLNVSDVYGFLKLDGTSTALIENSSINGYGGNSAYEAISVADNSSLKIVNTSISSFVYGVSAYIGSLVDATGLFISNTTSGVLVADNSSLKMKDSKIKNCLDMCIEAFVLFNDTDEHNNLITYQNNSVSVTKSEITGGNYGIYVFNNTDINVSRSSIHDNILGVYLNTEDVYPDGASTTTLPSFVDTGYTNSFSENWWGDKSGPYNETSNPDGKGNVVSDEVNFTPYITHDPSIPQKTPVLIVPGVLGTEISKPNTDGSLEKLWLNLENNLTDFYDTFMDPLQFNDDLTPTYNGLVLGDVLRDMIFDIKIDTFVAYDYSGSLIKEFQNQGYTENSDLFLFPYDWRYGVSEDTVNQLKQKITDIMNETGSDKVDVIAHSTGGLLVKKYVMENPDSNNIDKAIFIGVPNTGAPNAIKTLLVGGNFGNRLLADSEMQKLARNLPVVYDLAPSEEYYKNKGSFVKILNKNLFSSTSTDLSFDDMTNFLTIDHNFNALAWHNAQNLHTQDFDNYDMRNAGVDLYAIDGCKTGTVTKILENHSDNPLLDLFTPTYSVQTESTGDGTVPLESATNLPINENNKYYALKADHGTMLSQDGIRQQIVNILSGTSTSISPDLITQDISKCNLNGRAISVYSPLSIDITDSSGNHAGLNPDGVSIENNIPNADYEILGEHKFVYLPTDNNQIYTIKISGTGDGIFTLTDTTIKDGTTTGMQVFGQIPVTNILKGNVNIGSTTTLTLDTNGDGVVEKTLQPNLMLGANDALNFYPEQLIVEKNNVVITPVNTQTNRGSNGHIIISNEKILPTVSTSSVVIETKKDENAIRSKITTSTKNLSITSIPENKKIVYTIPDNPKKIDDIITATVQKSNTPINSYVVFGSLVGLTVLAFISKKFIK